MRERLRRDRIGRRAAGTIHAWGTIVPIRTRCSAVTGWRARHLTLATGAARITATGSGLIVQRRGAHRSLTGAGRDAVRMPLDVRQGPLLIEVKGGTVDKAEMKRRVCAEIDRRADLLIQVGQDIYHDPELGFKEHRTAKIAAEVLQSLDLSVQTGLAVTGVKTVVDCGSAGPTVAVLGELDSLLVPDHPSANPETGAAHCCGHNAQIATMLGAAVGLVGSGVLPSLSGRVAFFAVPAEEYVEIEYRNELRRQGVIEFLGGKSELIARGAFDDVDMAMM